MGRPGPAVLVVFDWAASSAGSMFVSSPAAIEPARLSGEWSILARARGAARVGIYSDPDVPPARTRQGLTASSVAATGSRPGTEVPD